MIEEAWLRFPSIAMRCNISLVTILIVYQCSYNYYSSNAEHSVIISTHYTYRYNISIMVSNTIKVYSLYIIQFMSEVVSYKELISARVIV